jgi:hypothetical protein
VVVVRVKGGLGNQLFQYAAGKALAQRHGVRLGLDTRWYEADLAQRGLTERTFDLPHFAVDIGMASVAELRFCFASDDHRLRARIGRRLPAMFFGRRRWVHQEPGYDPAFEHLPPKVFLEGYFQHPAYFAGIEKQLRREFRLRESPPAEVVSFAEMLSATASVCIQVRRSDYVSNASAAQVHGVSDEEYYRAAWARVVAKVPAAQGYVFSDDQAWAEWTFADWPRVSVVEPSWNGPAYLHKFYLMCACRHFIIANSTWGWWAAWLGEHPDKVVVMPTRWFRDEVLNEATFGLRIPGWIVCEIA